MDNTDGSPSLNRELSLSRTNHLRSAFLKNEEHTPNGKSARAAYMKTFGMASVNSSSDVVAVSYELVGLLSRPRLTAIRFERPKHLTYKAGAQQFTDLLVASIGNDQPPLKEQVTALIIRPRQAYHTTLPQTCFHVLSAIQQTATAESAPSLPAPFRGGCDCPPSAQGLPAQILAGPPSVAIVAAADRCIESFLSVNGGCTGPSALLCSQGRDHRRAQFGCG
jgi:hypothetical protein